MGASLRTPILRKPIKPRWSQLGEKQLQTKKRSLLHLTRNWRRDLTLVFPSLKPTSLVRKLLRRKAQHLHQELMLLKKLLVLWHSLDYRGRKVGKMLRKRKMIGKKKKMVIVMKFLLRKLTLKRKLLMVKKRKLKMNKVRMVRRKTKWSMMKKWTLKSRRKWTSKKKMRLQRNQEWCYLGHYSSIWERKRMVRNPKMTKLQDQLTSSLP